MHHSFHSGTAHCAMQQTQGLEFYQLIFDFICQKFDDNHALLQTHHVLFEQSQCFKQLFDLLLPDVLGETAKLNLDPNQKAVQELVSRDSYSDLKLGSQISTESKTWTSFIICFWISSVRGSLAIKPAWKICSVWTLGDEGWNRLTAVLNFGDFKGPKKKSSSTQTIPEVQRR